MIGQKGLPATWGGIEHHVENLGAGLAARGHKVTVFCRPYYSSDLKNNPDIEMTGKDPCRYKGMSLEIIRSVKTKHLDAISHSALSATLAACDGFDIVHFHGIGPSLVSFLPRIAGKKVVSTIHALDYRQKKWGRFAKLCLKAGLKCSVTYPQKSICVSHTIENYLDRNDQTITIPNGVKDPCRWGNDELDWIRSRGLEPSKYVLFVGRLIADKGCHLASKAVSEIGGGLKLAVAGDSSFTDDYVGELKRSTGPETVFLGSVYNSRLSALYANCALFVLPSSVEGLPIVLIEAMKHRAPVLASDIAENMEVLTGLNGDGPIGLSFKNRDVSSLREAIAFALSDPELLDKMTDNAYDYVGQHYNWSSIVEKTEQVYYDVLGTN